MATYSRFEQQTTKVIFRIPAPAPYVEVQKALAAAMGEIEDAGLQVSDDLIRIEPHDDAVDVFYIKDGNVSS
jgi:hypothetical protein